MLLGFCYVEVSCGVPVYSTKTFGTEREETEIMLENNESLQCEDFIYLGGVISQA